MHVCVCIHTSVWLDLVRKERGYKIGKQTVVARRLVLYDDDTPTYTSTCLCICTCNRCVLVTHTWNHITKELGYKIGRHTVIARGLFVHEDNSLFQEDFQSAHVAVCMHVCMYVCMCSCTNVWAVCVNKDVQGVFFMHR